MTERIVSSVAQFVSAMGVSQLGDKVRMAPGALYGVDPIDLSSHRYGPTLGAVQVTGIPGQLPPILPPVGLGGAQGIDFAVNMNYTGSHWVGAGWGIHNKGQYRASHIRILGGTVRGNGNLGVGVSIYELGPKDPIGTFLGWPDNVYVIDTDIAEMYSDCVDVYGGQQCYIKPKCGTSLNTDAHCDGVQIAAGSQVIVALARVQGQFTEKFTAGPNQGILAGGGGPVGSPEAKYWFVEDLAILDNEVAWTGPGIVLGGAVNRAWIAANSVSCGQYYVPFSSSPGGRLIDAPCIQQANKSMTAANVPAGVDPRNVGVCYRNNALDGQFLLESDGDPAPDEDYNIATRWTGLTPGTHSRTGSPMFTASRPGGDFSLAASSLARAAGESAFRSLVRGFAADPVLGWGGGLPATDFFGKMFKLLPDMGAVQSS